MDTPVFDFTNGYSHKEARENDLKMKRLRFLDMQLAKGQFETLEAFEAALATYNELVTVLDSFISRVLVSVPREWLVPGAPEIIDWSKPDSLSWLNQDWYQDLMEAAVEAKKPENVAKN